MKKYLKNTRTNQHWVSYLVGVLLLSIGLPVSTFATHIVGGSINYRALGSDQYEITLRVYRDCANGAPGAVFDDPASIGVFDQFGSLLMDLRIPFISQDTVNNRPDACLVVPQDVCVHTTTYVDTVSLPFLAGGYQLVYQRCCRNVTINNLIDPLETGATYDVWLTEEAMQRENSSPVFREWPPIFICANEELNFDHSAVDVDNDSLVYRLCMPVQGGTFAQPKPQPPNPPPYDEVVLSEPYTLENLLGFGVPLAVNQQSGLMTVTPELLGQYVVGVCVEEYDRETKQLLSSVRRDFQYNVINCEPFRASFNAPDAVCDDFTVQFENLTPAGVDDFLWLFDSPNETLTSTERSPVFEFPAPGTYTVEMIAEPNTVCEERFTKEIIVQTNSLAADFRVDVLACTDTAFLFLVDQSTDSVGAAASWEWLITPDNGAAFTVTGRFPIVQVPLNSTGSIALTATSGNGCVSTFTNTYDAAGIDLTTLLADTLVACTGDQLFLNPNTPEDIQLSYRWIGSGLSDNDAVNPSITVLEGTNVYELTISGPPNSCTINHTLVVIGGSNPALDFNAFSNCDGLSYRFENTSGNSSSIQWVIGNLNSPIFTSTDENFDFTFSTPGMYDVYLIGMAGCTDTISKTIRVVEDGDLGLDFSFEYDECIIDGVDVLFTAETTSTDSIISWEWTLEDGRTSNLQNPVFAFLESGTLNVTLAIESIGGCVDNITKEIQVNLLEDIIAQLPDTIGLCGGLATQLLPTNDGNYSYEWTPATGLSDPNVPNPVFSLPGVYNVEITLAGSATCLADKDIVATIPNDIGLVLTGGGVTCDAELTLEASTSADAQIDWYLEDVLVATDVNTFVADQSGANTYTVVATDRFGCTDTSTIGVNLIGVNVNIPESIAACDGENIQATVTNLNDNDQLTFLWSPANLISSGQGTSTVTIDAPIGVSQVFVEIDNQSGCSLTDTIDVVIVDPDNALNFTVEPFCDGLTVQFTNTSQNADRFLWSFGDPNNPNATSTDVNPAYTYSELGTYTVTLTLQDDVSCTDTISRTFTLTDTTSFQADFEATLVACQPGSVTFQFNNLTDSSDPNLNYEYRFEDGTIFNDPDFELTITEYGTQEVTLIVSSEEGCIDSLSQTITFPVIELDLPDTISYCDMDGLVLNPNGNTAYDYQWANRSGITDLNVASPEVNPTETTTYVVTVTANGTGQCVQVDSVTILVPDSPLILDLPDEINACGPTVLSTAVEDTESLTWEDQDGNIIGMGASITVEPITMATYYLRAVDQFGCEALDSVKVTNLGVNAEIQPGTTISVCTQQDILVQVANLDQNDILTYQWLPAELILSGGDQAMPTLVPLDQGSYELSVIVRNQFDCSDTLEVTINVGDLVVNLPDEILVCGEDAVALNPQGSDNLVYQWSPATGLDDPTSSNPIFTGTMSTTYVVSVSDPLGGPDCMTTDTVEVIIGNAIEITAAPFPDTACVGVSLNLEASATSGTINWYEGEGFTDLNTTGTQLEISVIRGENIYYAIASEDGGCTDTVRYSITGIQIEDLGLQERLEGCIGEQFDLFPNAPSGFTYEWSSPELLDDATAANPRTVPLSQDVTFLVTVTLPEVGCTLQGQVFVNVKDDIIVDRTEDTTVCPQTSLDLEVIVEEGATFTWLDAEGNALGQTSPLTVMVDTTDLVITIVAVDMAGCEQREEIAISVQNIEDTGLEPQVEICAEDPTAINPNGNSNYTYTWSPTDGLDLSDPSNPIATLTSNQTYQVTVTDPATGCELATEVEVIVLENVIITSRSNDTTVCTADPLTLQATTNIPNTLQWFDDAEMTNLIGTGNSIIVTPAEGSNLYYVKTTDENCVDERDQAVIEVIRGNAVEITAEPFPDTACVGISLTLEATALGGTINWYQGEDFTDLNTTGNQLNINIVRGENLYYAIVSEDGGCTDTARYSITGIQIEDLELQERLEGCIGDQFDLFPNANLGFSYQWSPAELLEDATAANPRTVPLAQDVTFQVTVTLPETGCTLQGQVFVNVKDDIIVDRTEDTTVCPQTSLDLEVIVEEGATFTWLDAEGNALGQTSPLTVMVDTTDLVITIVAVDMAGCEQREEIAISVQNIEDTGLEPQVEICAEDPTAINPNGNANYTYTWSPTDGLDLSDPSNPIATLTSNQTYQVTVTDPATGCELATEVEVIVLENVIITSRSNDTTVCSADPLTLQATTNIPNTLQWFDDAEMTNLIGTGNSIVVTPADGSNLYYVKTTDENCVDERDQAVIEVIRGSTVELMMEPFPDTACVGISLTLEATATGGTINWYQGEEFMDLNTTGNQLNINIVRGENLYYAIVSEDGGCTDTARYSITGIQIEDLELQERLEGCIGDQFDLFPNTNLGFSYQWSPAELLEDATAANPRTVPLAQDVTFQVTVTLPETGCTLEGEVLVDVKDDIILEITEDTTVCPQTTVRLEAQIEAGASIVWQDQDGNILGQMTSVEVQVDTTDVVITAIARDVTGCEQEAEVNIFVDGLDDVGLEGGGIGSDGSKLPIETCEGTPTELNPNGNPAYEYMWSPADLLDLTNPHNPIATLERSQLFNVTVTDPVTMCTYVDSIFVEVIEDIRITVTSNDTMICEPTELTLMAMTNLPTTLEWFDDAEMTNSIGNGENIQVLPEPGVNIYYVKTGDERCVDGNDVDTIQVEVVDFDMVAPDSIIDNVCLGEEINLNPRGDDRFSYEWTPADGLSDPSSPNPSITADMDRQLMVTITSPDGMCTTTRTVDIRLNDPVNLDAGRDTVLCSTGTFTISATGDNPQNVMWSDDRDFNNIISTELELEVDLVPGGQFYYVKAENGECPAEIDSVFLGSGLIDATLSERTLVCDPSQGAVLTVTNNNLEQELTYFWMPDENFEDPTAGPTATLNPGVDGRVTVLLENQFGCSAELSSEVVIEDIGDAVIRASATSVSAGTPVDLTVDNCVDCTYEWSPADSFDNPNGQTVRTIPLETTTYSVIVRKGDCERILTITIETTGELCSVDNVFVPNAFTPNGDGINDILFVRSNVIDVMHLIVFNRWGQEVFDSRDINVGWDGTFRGRRLPPDVYGYYLEVTCIGGGTLTIQGNVTLLR